MGPTGSGRSDGSGPFGSPRPVFHRTGGNGPSTTRRTSHPDNPPIPHRRGTYPQGSTGGLVRPDTTGKTQTTAEYVVSGT